MSDVFFFFYRDTETVRLHRPKSCSFPKRSHQKGVALQLNLLFLRGKCVFKVPGRSSSQPGPARMFTLTGLVEPLLLKREASN